MIDTHVDPERFTNALPDTDAPVIYLAGPILFAENGGRGWRDRVTEDWPDQFGYINPLDVFDGSEDVATVLPKDELEEYDADPDEATISDEELVETDKALVREADALLIGFPERCASWGTPQEQAEVWGSNAFGDVQPTKPVATYHGDQAMEDLSPWLRYHSTFLSADLGECMNYLSEEVR